MSTDLLTALDDHSRATLLRSARRRRFRRGEVVFHEGDLGDSLHVVRRGVFVARSAELLGAPIVINVFGAGDVFGEGVLIAAETRRAATVSALRSGDTLMVTRHAFDSLRERDPRLDRFLVSVLAQRNRELAARLVELLGCPAPTRVYRRLLAFASLVGGEAELGWIKLGQGDLAMLAGTTRPTANRALRRAEQQGLVELARGAVRITDLPGLVAAAR